MNRPTTLLLLCLGVLGLSPAALADAEWPGWRGPNRDGKSPDTGLLQRWPAGGPPLLWKVDSVGGGFSNVAVAGGFIYTTGDEDGRLIVHAFDLQGQRAWRVDHDAAWSRNYDGARSTPTIDGGKLYVVSGHGVVGCYDAVTGKPRWTRRFSEFGGRPPEWGYSESVLIYKQLAVVRPGGKRCLVALDKKTGKTVWTSSGFDAGAEYGSNLAFTFEKVPLIAAGTRAGIVGVSAKNGRVVFNDDWCEGNTANCPTPAYADGYLFWANGYGKGGVCLKLTRRRKKIMVRRAWTTRDMVCHHGGYVIHEGSIYGNHRNGWACLDLKTGEKRWGGKAVGKGSLCFADGMLYLFGEREGKVALAAASPDGLEVRGEMQVEGEGTSWAHPVVVGGRLYLRYSTNLYCFDVKAR